MNAQLADGISSIPPAVHASVPPEMPLLTSADPLPRDKVGDILACGFGISAAVWTAAYICRLPFFLLSGQFTIAAMLAAVFVGGFFAARYSSRGFWCALYAGALSGFLDLLIVGSLMEDYVKTHHETGSSAVPASVLWVLGSIALNAVIASLGGFIGQLLQSPRARRAGGVLWTHVFAFILFALTLMLIGAGGMVTAHHAGLAVPDWPTSYNYNMFLLPFSVMQQTGHGANEGIFYEHAHRLLASLVGFTSLTLAIYISFSERHRTRMSVLGLIARALLVVAGGVACLIAVFRPGAPSIGAAVVLAGAAVLVLIRSAIRTWRAEARGWVIVLAWAIGFGVLVQAILGGTRVTETSITLAIIHGIFAQMVFAAMAALAAATTRSFYEFPPVHRADASTDRGIAAVLLGALVVQLTLGAIVRHTDTGVLIHITMAAFVTVLILGCGFRAWGLHGKVRPVRRAGIALMGLVVLQLTLGVLALVFWTGNAKNAPMTSAIFTTLHQMNGALLLAMAAVLAAWAWRLLRPAPTE